MRKNESQLIRENFPSETNIIYPICFALLFLAVFLFHGKSVPFSNEFLYLLRLKTDFLPNDWTFSQPATEHWFFNRIFSFPARFLSLEIVGWTGRIVVWILCLRALLKLGERWKIPVWATAISIFLWLAFGQAVVNDEWIFGGFEAKTVSYAFLLFGLNDFAEKKIVTPSIWLGLCFSFHSAIGLWAIPAVGLALLFEKTAFVDLVKVVFITGVFSLFGLIPLLAEPSNIGAYSFDDWRFVVLERVPWHLDLFRFSKSGTILIFVMLIFNCAALWKDANFALRFLLKFQIFLGAFFLLGLFLRWFELYSILRMMPTRLFPIITPLFFLFTVFYTVRRLDSKKYKLAVSIFAVLVIAVLNPFKIGIGQVRQTIESRQAAPDDLQKTSEWIAANTPVDALVIQPPQRRDFWYFSHRASVVSFAYPVYSHLSEWRARVKDLSDNLQIKKAETGSEEIEAAYNGLSEAQIERIKNKYAATHLVSRAVYSYPIIFETETYKVYRLP